MNTKNSEQTDLNLGLTASATPTKNYRAPVYRVALVRDGSVSASASRETADSPNVVAQLVRKLIGDSPQEHLVAICVDARSRVIGISEVSRGTLSASLVHPRETFRTAILLNAAGLIVAHNHPSGDCNPSPDDRDTTRRLVRAGEIVGVPILDHVILAGGVQPEGTGKSFFSFREAGLIG
jgi:DNA repair protein RadC